MTEPNVTAPTVREINAETNATRKAVLAAMDRMLRGSPTIARPGVLSKAGLAREAQVDRSHITQGSCRDLGDRFAAIIAQRREPSTAREVEQQARIELMARQLADLRQSQERLRGERDKWQASTHTLLRAVQVLRLENTALQAEVRSLRRRPVGPFGGSNTGLYQVPLPTLSTAKLRSPLVAK